MTISPPQDNQNRSKIAHRIVELSDGVLSEEKKHSYIALKVGSRVAAVVSNSDRVQFLIPSTELQQKVTEKQFSLKEAPKSIPMHEHKFYIRGLNLDQLNANEPLFREIIRESVSALKRKTN